MRVFISWSGEPSRSIAQALREWLPLVVQYIDPWMSDADIDSGARWDHEIATALDGTNFGLVCVSRENQAAPWMIFEAGALAKSVGTGRVVPLCIDLRPSDITGPLAAFQSRSLNKDGLRRLVGDMNKTADRKMSTEQLNNIFDAMWPGLATAVDRALAGGTSQVSIEPLRKTGDMLAEVVEKVRRIESRLDADAYVKIYDPQATMFSGRLETTPLGLVRLNRVRPEELMLKHISAILRP